MAASLGCGVDELGSAEEGLPARVSDSSAEDGVTAGAGLLATGELAGTDAGGVGSPGEDFSVMLFCAAVDESGAGLAGGLTRSGFFSSPRIGLPAACWGSEIDLALLDSPRSGSDEFGATDEWLCSRVDCSGAGGGSEILLGA